MNRSIHDKEIDNGSLISRFSRNNDPRRVLQPVVTRTSNVNSDVVDYKNVSLCLTGEVSSASICRSSLTLKQHNTSLIGEIAEENNEQDDEQFILDMKKKIAQNCELRNDENYDHARDLQSRSLYSARKRKCILSDEDQNLMKRFRESVDGSSKAVCVAATPRNSQSRNAASGHDTVTMMTIDTPHITPAVSFNETDANRRDDIGNKRVLFRVASMTHNDDRLMTPANTDFASTEMEIEQLVYYEQCFTPPERND